MEIKNFKVIGKYYGFSEHWENWNLNFGSWDCTDKSLLNRNILEESFAGWVTFNTHHSFMQELVLNSLQRWKPSTASLVSCAFL